MKFVMVPEKVTKEMVEATRGICWTSSTEYETVQLLWDRMLAASGVASGEMTLANKNAVFKLGKTAGIEEVQERIKDALNIKDCFCDKCS